MDPVETIWIIDDDKTSCFLAERLLRRVPEVSQVVSLHSALDALATIKELSSNPEKLPGIILLDINMPRMNGFEFLAELAQQQLNLSNTRIYMFTTSSRPQDKDKAAAAPIPISGYITKPLTPEKLTTFLN